jgi:hypothetical protein
MQSTVKPDKCPAIRGIMSIQHSHDEVSRIHTKYTTHLLHTLLLMDPHELFEGFSVYCNKLPGMQWLVACYNAIHKYKKQCNAQVQNNCAKVMRHACLAGGIHLHNIMFMTNTSNTRMGSCLCIARTWNR